MPTLQAVERGELPQNHEIMRQIRALSHRLPVLEAERFQPDFFTQVLFLQPFFPRRIVFKFRSDEKEMNEKV